MTNRLKAELRRDAQAQNDCCRAQKSNRCIQEKKMEYVHFADNLMSHAQNEEEVLYPASILVGELKLKLIE